MATSDDENISMVDGANDDVVPRFTIDSETNRQYRSFNARGTELTVRLLPPAVGDNSDAITHFQASVNDLFDYALRNSEDSDMVGITIHNEVNLLDKAIGFSFRRKDQLTDEVIWSVFSKVAQSNARYNALDRMIVVIHSVKMPVGFGSKAVKSKGRPLSETVRLKHSIIEVKAKTNCLAHALIIAIARLTKDPNYISYRKGNKILPQVQQLLRTTGIDLQNGGRVHEIQQFQDHFSEYKIVVYGGLKCDDIIFEGRVTSEQRINLLYDDVERHYHVIANLTGAMAKRYICEACNKSYRSGVTHKCREKCSDCMSIPPCIVTDVRIPCESCNRTFRSQSCFDKHKYH
jgi:hypothetical protein